MGSPFFILASFSIMSKSSGAVKSFVSLEFPEILIPFFSNPLKPLNKKIHIGVESTPLTDFSKPSGANAEWLKVKIKYKKTGN